MKAAGCGRRYFATVLHSLNVDIGDVVPMGFMVSVRSVTWSGVCPNLLNFDLEVIFSASVMFSVRSVT